MTKDNLKILDAPHIVFDDKTNDPCYQAMLEKLKTCKGYVVITVHENNHHMESFYNMMPDQRVFAAALLTRSALIDHG